MIPLLAQQSVDRKVSDHISVITGNYEYYYACGLLSGRHSLSLSADLTPQEMYDRVQDFLKDVPLMEPAEDSDDAYLSYLLRRYEPDERYDDQMKELFESGKEIKNPQ